MLKSFLLPLSKLTCLIPVLLAAGLCTAQDTGAATGDAGDAGSITLDAAGDAAAMPEKASPFPPEMQAAIDKFKTRDFKGAEAMLKEMVAKNPAYPPSGVFLGRLYAGIKQPAAARAAFEQAVRDNPDDPEAYVVFADSALQQRRFTDAVLLYEKGNAIANSYTTNETRKKSLQVRSLNGIAAVTEARGDFPGAEASLNKVLAMEPLNPAALNRLGRVLFQKGTKADEQKAYETFQKLYETNPAKMTRHEINMAKLYQGKGQGKQAEKLVKLALQRDGKNLVTVLSAAQWALETGNADFAEEIATQAKAIDAKSAQVQLLSGIIARMKGDYAKAETELRQGQTLAPSNVMVLNQLALALGSQEDKAKIEQAVEFSQMATRLFPDARQAIGRECGVTLSWILSRLGKQDVALKQLQNMLQNGPVGTDASYYAAEVLHKSGRSDMATQLLKSAIENGRGVFPARKQAEDLLRKINGGQ